MKHFSPTTFLIFTPRRRIVITPEFLLQRLRISHFSTYPSTFQSSCSHASSFPSQSHEEESRNVRVSVWWDFENCPPPVGTNVFRISQRVTAAVRTSGIKGSVHITAFGEVMQLSRSNQEALSATGINLAHIPSGGKNSADRSLLVDLMYWVSQNPPPAHVFLISGDRDFAGILHRLRMNNYNILLASPESSPSVLCSAASIMWQWQDLVKGDNRTARYFNQPPDGPYSSWYGHYKVSLENPFACNDKPPPASSASAQVKEVAEANSEPKYRPVPKAVLRQIRHILISYPNGLSITELRSELGKSNVAIDKNLYGYKKFSLFLMSMPDILKLQSGSDGQFFVYGVAQKEPQSVDSTPSSATRPVTEKPTAGPKHKVISKGSATSEDINKKASLPPILDLNVKDPTKEAHEPVKPLQDHALLPEKIDNASISEKHSCKSSSEIGFCRRIWRKLFTGTDDVSANRSSYLQENGSTSGEETEVSKEREKLAEPAALNESSVSPVPLASSSLSSKESVKNDKADMGNDSCGDDSCRDQRLIDKFISKCKVWGWGSSLDPQSEKLNQTTFDSGKHKVFSSESFWKQLEAFFDTPPNGAVLILQSRNREQMAQNLKKHGPLSVRSLEQSDLIHLVDLLITEKKWIKELPSQNYPFSLIRPAGSNTASLNGLQSLFSSTQIPSDSQRSTEIDGKKKYQNVHCSGTSSPSVTIGKSRTEILSDCQKLTEYIAKEHPQGFNMGGFGKLFFERNGYNLDSKALGYEKLTNLMQVMPGVKVESTHIVPYNGPGVESNWIGATESSDSDGSKKGDGSDSPWEELGPVANTCNSQKVSNLKLRTAKEDARPMDHDYEPLAIDDFSDSEDETTSSTRLASQAEPRLCDDGSQWSHIFGLINDHSGTSRKEPSGNGDNTLGSSSANVSKPSNVLGAVRNYEGKKQPSKNICFVADSNEQRLTESIVDILGGNMENSGKSRIRS